MNSTHRTESTNFDGDYIKHYGTSSPDAILNYYTEKKEDEKARRFLEYRKKWESIKRGELVPAKPIEIDFSFSNACNISCAHCYRKYDSSFNSNISIPLDVAKKLIEEARDIGVSVIVFGNDTEFYMYHHCDEILEFASSLQFEEIIIVTNGILLNEHRIDSILNSNVTRLCISIDALSRKVYEDVRSEWYFRLMANIFSFLHKRKKLKKKLPLLRVSFIEYNLNINEREDFVRFWTDSADEVDVQTMVDVKNVNELRYGALSTGGHCTYPCSGIYIDWNGNYRPCCSFFSKHLIIGNISNMTILQAWNSEYMIELRMKLQKGGLNIYCSNCLQSLHCREVLKSIKEEKC